MDHVAEPTVSLTGKSGANRRPEQGLAGLCWGWASRSPAWEQGQVGPTVAMGSCGRSTGWSEGREAQALWLRPMGLARHLSPLG